MEQQCSLTARLPPLPPATASGQGYAGVCAMVLVRSMSSMINPSLVVISIHPGGTAGQLGPLRYAQGQRCAHVPQGTLCIKWTDPLSKSLWANIIIWQLDRRGTVC